MHGTASLAGALTLRVLPEPKNCHTCRSSAEASNESRKPDAVCSVLEASRKPDAVCSVLEASHAANSGPTTMEQVPRSTVSKVSESLAAG